MNTTTPTTGFPARPTPASSAPASAPVRPGGGRLVTDAPTRAFHALIALSFAAAYATADSEHWRALHVALGYALGGLLVLRTVYGFIGPRSARLSLAFKKLTALPGWLRSVRQAVVQGDVRALPWQQTQNLALAVTIALVLALITPLVLSGLGTYNEWDAALGGEWFEEIHEFIGEFMLAAVIAHTALIVGMSLLRRKNQAQRMISGRIEGMGPDLVAHNRRGWAVLLVVATVTFVVWQGFIVPGAAG